MGFFEELNPEASVTGGVKKVPSHIKFNKEQELAVNNIRRFLKSKESYYNLIGKGGTGKTTVIAGALNHCKSGVIGIAISHKAKQRLSDSIKKCYTFASACGMRAITDDFGNKRFVINEYAKRQPIKYANIIVIDECSMISNEDIRTIERLKRDSAKVIYMGDFRQLPPIDGSGKDSYTFKVKNSSSLTVRMRQGIGNPIIELSDAIANEIESRTYNHSVIYEHLEDVVNADGKGYTYMDDSKFIDKFVADFKANDSTKFICFRTKTVSLYNKLIRESIYKDVKDVFIPGELVIANDSYSKSGDQLVIQNSCEYYVESVELGTYKGYECHLISFKDVMEIIPVLTDKGKVLWNKELKRLSAKRMWKSFWPLKESFANIDYAYAINTHKSQGSTYKNVYMNFNDILNVTKISDKEKCQSMYVAITRASHHLYLLDI